MRVLTIALALVLTATGCGSGEDGDSMRIRFGATETSWSATDRSAFIVACIDHPPLDAETLDALVGQYGLSEDEVAFLVEDAEAGWEVLETSGFSIREFCDCYFSGIEKRASFKEIGEMDYWEMMDLAAEAAEPC